MANGMIFLNHSRQRSPAQGADSQNAVSPQVVSGSDPRKTLWDCSFYVRNKSLCWTVGILDMESNKVF